MKSLEEKVRKLDKRVQELEKKQSKPQPVSNNVADLLIAATALEYRIPLITKNPKKFKNISEIEVRSKI